MVNIDTGLFINTATAADRSTATQARRALGALLNKQTDGITPQPGRLVSSGKGGVGGLLVQSASTSALNFLVTSGYAVVTRSAAPALGGYIVGTPSDVTLTLTAANATNPRIDAVYICQPDPEAGDSTHARIDVVVGTPAASPAAPADALLPQGSLRIANITVPAAATAASACTITVQNAFEAGLSPALPVYAGVANLPVNAPYGALAIVQNSGVPGIPSNTTFKALGPGGVAGTSWWVWDCPGNIMGTCFVTDTNVGYDSGPGQNSVAVRGGMLIFNFSLYTGAGRILDGSQAFGQFYTQFRPQDGTFAQAPGTFFDSGYGYANFLVNSAGYLIGNQKLGGNGGSGANGIRGSLHWRIA